MQAYDRGRLLCIEGHAIVVLNGWPCMERLLNGPQTPLRSIRADEGR